MKVQTLVRWQNRKGEQGSIMVMSVVGMLSFLLAVGLGVDISHLYLAKNELQNAADAAALAGASGLNSGTKGITIATDRACHCGSGDTPMNNYDFGKQGVTIPRANVRFARNLQDFASGADFSETAASAPGLAPSIKFVQVTTPPSPVGVSFAAIVLGNTRNLSAQAIAGMSAPLNVFTGYLPVSVIDDDGLTQITPGSLYTIRAAPQGSVSPGNYQILAIDGSGAADDRTGLASGVRNPVGPGGYVETKPGVSAGAVSQGINTRFDDYASGMDPADYPPDTNIKEGITADNYDNGSPSEPSSHPLLAAAGRRIVLIPIVKQSQFDGGRTNVQIDHFGAFFLRSKVQGGNGGDIQAEYIGVGVVVGSGGYDPTGPANGGPPITKPVLYQ